jgi:AbrB family looped-hinge helix DNA binding protein
VETRAYSWPLANKRYNDIDGWANPVYCTKMNTRLIIDKAGRVVIPKPLREELHLEAGDALEMVTAGEQITLRPVRGTGPLTKEHGVWDFAGSPCPPPPRMTCCSRSARSAT